MAIYILWIAFICNLLKLKMDVNELYRLNEFINGLIQKEDFQVDLILEEVFANIVKYSDSEYVDVYADFKDQTLSVEFVDNGIPFNPLLKEDPKLPDNIDDAKIGGLGIFLTKELADELDYQNVNGENHLKIIKKVE